MKPEVAFYYPGQYWTDPDWAKNLILFFDGVAFVIPEYMRDFGRLDDLPVIASLKEHDLFRVIRPEETIGPSETEMLSTALVEVIASGRLDHLSKTSGPASDRANFGSISMSRLGYHGDAEIAHFVFRELEERGLAGQSADGVAIPMHRTVRALVLVLLAQILRGKGDEMGITLSPTTDQLNVVKALDEIISSSDSEPSTPSIGHIVSFDMAMVGVDLASVPMDEVLGFRKQNYSLHRNYSLAVRRFARELSLMPEDERNASFEQRQEEIDEAAQSIKSLAEKTWRKRISFGLTLAGGASSIGGNFLGPVLSLVGALVGNRSAEAHEPGVYSYLFSARQSLR